jgi:hypothetical protein
MARPQPNMNMAPSVINNVTAATAESFDLDLCHEVAGHNVNDEDDSAAFDAKYETSIIDSIARHKYRFSGQVRTMGIVIPAGIVNVGGCLRTSNGAQPKGVSGDTGWAWLTYDFEVRDDTERD